MRVPDSPKISDKIFLADLYPEFYEMELDENPKILEQPDDRAWVKFRRATGLDDKQLADFGKSQIMQYSVPDTPGQFTMTDVHENPKRMAMFEVWMTLVEIGNLDERDGSAVFFEQPVSKLPFPVFEGIWYKLDNRIVAAIYAACLSINREWGV